MLDREMRGCCGPKNISLVSKGHIWYRGKMDERIKSVLHEKIVRIAPQSQRDIPKIFRLGTAWYQSHSYIHCDDCWTIELSPTCSKHIVISRKLNQEPLFPSHSKTWTKWRWMQRPSSKDSAWKHPICRQQYRDTPCSPSGKWLVCPECCQAMLNQTRIYRPQHTKRTSRRNVRKDTGESDVDHRTLRLQHNERCHILSLL